MEHETRKFPRIEDTPLDGVKVIYPKIFVDHRGFFSETYNVKEWASELGFQENFQQDNHSYSKYAVVRGLHIQPGMGKLVSVIKGEIYDVAVDARPTSPDFGKYYGINLSEKNRRAFWVPDGFLHGFQVVSDDAHVYYKCSSTHNPKTEFGVNPADQEIGIEWPIPLEQCVLSEKDAKAPLLKDAIKR